MAPLSDEQAQMENEEKAKKCIYNKTYRDKQKRIKQALASKKARKKVYNKTQRDKKKRERQQQHMNYLRNIRGTPQNNSPPRSSSRTREQLTPTGFVPHATTNNSATSNSPYDIQGNTNVYPPMTPEQLGNFQAHPMCTMTPEQSIQMIGARSERTRQEALQRLGENGRRLEEMGKQQAETAKYLAETGKMEMEIYRDQQLEEMQAQAYYKSLSSPTLAVGQKRQYYLGSEDDVEEEGPSARKRFKADGARAFRTNETPIFNANLPSASRKLEFGSQVETSHAAPMFAQREGVGCFASAQPYTNEPGQHNSSHAAPTYSTPEGVAAFVSANQFANGQGNEEASQTVPTLFQKSGQAKGKSFPSPSRNKVSMETKAASKKPKSTTPRQRALEEARAKAGKWAVVDKSRRSERKQTGRATTRTTSARRHSSAHNYQKGDEVYYKKDDEDLLAKIVGVHKHKGEPDYYTIQFIGPDREMKERQTVADRIHLA